MLNLAIFGPPGAGKGTQREALLRRYGLEPVAPGEIFRQAVLEGTAIGRQVERYINAGQFVPEHLTVEVVERSLAAYGAGAKFLFDGFPRSIFQAKALDRILVGRRSMLDLVLFLEVGEAEVMRRIAGRSVLGRVDDQDPKKVEKRLALYRDHTLPVLDYYGSQGKLVKVPGDEGVEEVRKHLAAAIEQRFPSSVGS